MLEAIDVVQTINATVDGKCCRFLSSEVKPRVPYSNLHWHKSKMIDYTFSKYDFI